MKKLFVFLAIIFGLSVITVTGKNRQSIFLCDDVKGYLMNLDPRSQDAQLLKALQLRVLERSYTMSLTNPEATTEWWHHCYEYVSDAALIYALYPTERLEAWLRASVLGIVRRPMADWAGPRFRGYGGGDLVGSLETAHLTWAVSMAYDLAPQLFSGPERKEIEDAIRNKGMIPCYRYLRQSNTYHNWNCITFGGLSIGAAVLGDKEYLQQALDYLPVALDHFQKDGSYGESLQYANYAAYGLMMAQESLLRAGVLQDADLSFYGKIVDWAYYAHLYRKPLSGWPLSNLARSANFGDCASVFRPSGDLLMHIALRGKKSIPAQAALSRWMLNYLYTPANEDIPHELASFGMVNDFGALTLILGHNAAEPVAPKAEDYSLVHAFSGGDAFIRDAWGGKTVIAARIPAEPRHAFAHLHGDAGSFILAHNNERLLVDAGHTCYRNVTRDIDIATNNHNTCTFDVLDSDGNVSKIQQSKGENRMMKPFGDGIGKSGYDPVSMGGKRILCTSKGPVSVIGSDLAGIYGAPLKEFKRYIVLCGSNAVFVVDMVKSDKPVRTTWNWMLNNRDNNLKYEFTRNHFVEAVRNNSGIKITNYVSDLWLGGPFYAMMHDCYQILPGQFTEGIPGSAIMFRFADNEYKKDIVAVHTMSVDTPAALDSWESSYVDGKYVLESKSLGQKWLLELNGDSIEVTEGLSSEHYCF